MPIYMRYNTHADNGSMYNTPNCWAIYCCGKVFKYLKSIGGLEAMHKRNIDKAKVIYDFLDSSKMFHGTVEPEFRSLMNIPFVTESARSWTPKWSPPPRLPATTTSRATSPSAACARPSTTPCPRRASQALVDFLQEVRGRAQVKPFCTKTLTRRKIIMRILVTDGMDKTAMAELRGSGSRGRRAVL